MGVTVLISARFGKRSLSAVDRLMMGNAALPILIACFLASASAKSSRRFSMGDRTEREMDPSNAMVFFVLSIFAFPES